MPPLPRQAPCADFRTCAPIMHPMEIRWLYVDFELRLALKRGLGMVNAIAVRRVPDIHVDVITLPDAQERGARISKESTDIG
jgi:hypothetical protein